MEQLRNYCRELSIELSDHQLRQFQLYYDLLIEWNEKVNLTAITEYDEVLKKHFLDSLSLVKASETDIVNQMFKGSSFRGKGEDQKGSDQKQDRIKLIDIGTGAGFPAIPLKIAYPQLSVVMLDSLNKRINFLNEVIRELELNDIIALHGRAEDFAKPVKGKQEIGKNLVPENICRREYFDIAVSRAVANLSTLSEYCLPYVREGGVFAAYKSEELAKERDAAERAVGILGGKVEKIYEFTLPYTDYHRSLCVTRKVKPTPKKYPRKAGLPSKEPLR